MIYFCSVYSQALLDVNEAGVCGHATPSNFITFPNWIWPRIETGVVYRISAFYGHFITKQAIMCLGRNNKYGNMCVTSCSNTSIGTSSVIFIAKHLKPFGKGIVVRLSQLVNVQIPSAFRCMTVKL